MGWAILRVSTTQISYLQDCYRKYELRYIDKLVPKPPDIPHAMRRGVWIHACLEAVHRDEPVGPTLAALVSLAAAAGVSADEADKLREETFEIIDGYMKYWGDDKFKPVLLEKELELPLGEDTITATLDMLAEYKGGLWIVEAKSTSHIPSPLWRGVDPQTALQLLAARHEGHPVQGVIFDYLWTKKPTVPRVKVRENGFYANTGITTSWAFEKCVPEVLDSWRGERDEAERYLSEQRSRLVRDSDFFQRWTVSRDEGCLEETLRDVRHLLLHAKLCERTGYYPRSLNPRTCKARQNSCSYADLDMSEYIAGEQLIHMRKADFDIDDGSREGATARAQVSDTLSFVDENHTEALHAAQDRIRKLQSLAWGDEEDE